MEVGPLLRAYKAAVGAGAVLRVVLFVGQGGPQVELVGSSARRGVRFETSAAEITASHTYGLWQAAARRQQPIARVG